MKQSSLKIYPLLLLLGLLLSQCQEEERVFPEVQILAPGAASSYQFGDTLIMEFSAQPAQKVRYSLTSADQSYLLKGFLIDQVGNTYTVAFYLNEPYMPNGKYELKATADYKDESTSDFRTINYRELPLETKGYVAVGGGNLHKVDSVGNLSTVAIGTNYNWVEVLPSAQELFVAGASTPNLQVRRLQNLTSKFTVAGPNPPGAPQFYQLLTHNQAVFTLRADGFITSYTGDNNLGVSYELQESFPLQATFLRDQMVVALRKGLGSNLNELHLLNERFLGSAQTYFIGDANYQLTPIGQSLNQIALFKLGDSFELQTLNFNTQTATTRFIEPQVQFYDCKTLPNGDVIYSTQNGTFIYNIDLGLNPNKVLTFGAQDIEINKVTGAVLLLNNGLIQQLAPNGNLVYQGAVPGATDFEIIYNK